MGNRMSMRITAALSLALAGAACEQPKKVPEAQPPVVARPAVPAAPPASDAVGPAAPAPDASAAAPEAQGEILLGEVGSFSGPDATFGDSTHRGVMLAINELNANGGVKGRRLAVKWYDDQGRPEEAATAMTKLITGDKVSLVIGEVASSRSMAMAPVAENHKVPMISHASTNPKVTEGRQYVFRVCFIDPFQGLVMAKFARDHLKLGKVAILKDMRNDYSIGLAREFATNFERMKGKIVKEESYSAGDKDFKAQLAAIRSASPEAIFVPGYYADVGVIARQAQRVGLKVPLLGGDGWDSAKLYEIGGEAIEGSFFSNHYSTQDPSPKIQKFIEDFRKAYQDVPDAFAALGYDAVKVAANALARSKSLSGEELRAAIASTKEFDGVTGTITIDKDHNAVKPAVVLKVEGGKPVYQTTVAP